MEFRETVARWGPEDSGRRMAFKIAFGRVADAPSESHQVIQLQIQALGELR